MQVRSSSKKISDFIIGKTIGQGTFGKVKQGIHMPSGHKVAIKILQKNKISAQEDLARVHNELKILYQKVDHPNIIKLLQLHESPTNVYIITQFIQGKQLYQLIVEKGSLDPRLCGIYFCQLLDAVSYLHSIGICHRDIKPQNIMVNGENLKLIDFGLSTEFASDRMLATSCGSPCYAAPQMLKGTRYDCVKSDIWAIGVTLYAMAAGHLPFQHDDTDRLYEMINTVKLEPIRSMPETPILETNNNNAGSSPNISICPYILSHSTSLSLINLLLQNLLRLNPQHRPSLQQIHENIWIKQWQQYLKNTKLEYENDDILLNSMSKYFKLGVKDIREILDKKEIMSICTYYYLNRRKRLWGGNPKSYKQLEGMRSQEKIIPKSKSKSKSRQKDRLLFNSPKSRTNLKNSSQNNLLHNHNPQSTQKKSVLDTLPLINTDIHSPTTAVKQKSQSTFPQSVSNLSSKSILQEINNKGMQDHIPSSIQNHRDKQRQKKQNQQEQPEIHNGFFHVKYTFSTLEDVYKYIKNQLKTHENESQNQNQGKYVNNRIVQESSDEQQQQDQPEFLGNKFYNHPYSVQQHSQQQQQQQEQYIIQNNKYILTKPKPIQPQKQQHKSSKQQNTIIFHTKYKLEWQGIQLQIKYLQNTNMYYLQVPTFFP